MIEATIAALKSPSYSPYRRRGCTCLRNQLRPRVELPTRTTSTIGPVTIRGSSNRKPMRRSPGSFDAMPDEAAHYRAARARVERRGPATQLPGALAARGPGFRLALAREIERSCSADELLQGLLIDLLVFADVDRAPDIPLEAGVEEARRVLQRSSPGERQLHDTLVGLPRTHDAAVRPDGDPPLPLLDDLRIGLVDELAHFREHHPAPVPELQDPLVDQCGGRLGRGGLLHGLLQRSQ